MKTCVGFTTILSILLASHIAYSSTFRSPVEIVSVLELYSSEGCSSCPPADQWIARFKQSEQLWQKIIPIVYHVDYWDYLGWPDRFAKRAYSNRQSDYQRLGRINSVYTPGFVLNGHEWKGFFQREGVPLSDNKVGVLAVTVKDEQLAANFSPRQALNIKTVLNVALLGFDEKTQVTRGENRGEQLSHQFVVLEYLSTVELTHKKNQWSLNLGNLNKLKNNHKLGIAVWVAELDTQQPIQATGGFLD